MLMVASELRSLIKGNYKQGCSTVTGVRLIYCQPLYYVSLQMILRVEGLQMYRGGSCPEGVLFCLMSWAHVFLLS